MIWVDDFGTETVCNSGGVQLDVVSSLNPCRLGLKDFDILSRKPSDVNFDYVFKSEVSRENVTVGFMPLYKEFTVRPLFEGFVVEKVGKNQLNVLFDFVAGGVGGMNVDFLGKLYDQDVPLDVERRVYLAKGTSGKVSLLLNRGKAGWSVDDITIVLDGLVFKPLDFEGNYVEAVQKKFEVLLDVPSSDLIEPKRAIFDFTGFWYFIWESLTMMFVIVDGDLISLAPMEKRLFDEDLFFPVDEAISGSFGGVRVSSCDVTSYLNSLVGNMDEMVLG